MLERRGTSEANVPCARAAPSQCARMAIALVSPGAIARPGARESSVQLAFSTGPSAVRLGSNLNLGSRCDPSRASRGQGRAPGRGRRGWRRVSCQWTLRLGFLNLDLKYDPGPVRTVDSSGA